MLYTKAAAKANALRVSTATHRLKTTATGLTT
jgi:hypothetical protein